MAHEVVHPVEFLPTQLLETEMRRAQLSCQREPASGPWSKDMWWPTATSTMLGSWHFKDLCLKENGPLDLREGLDPAQPQRWSTQGWICETSVAGVQGSLNLR